MNWTSGQLNRSTKANKDPVRKKQNQYFARQRINQGPKAHSPLALGHYQQAAPEVASEPPRPVTSHFFPSDLNSSHNRPEIGIAGGHNSATHQKDNRRPDDPLEHVRRRLLKHRDWSGLALARPRPISFRSPAEMDEIGRRRKVSKTNAEKSGPRRAQREDRRVRPTETKLRALREGQTYGHISELDQIDCSIRVGSHIHQTQTTASAAPSNVAATKESTISRAGEAPQYQRDHAELSLAEISEENVNPFLIPLSEARQMKNFDEVQDRSSSIVRQASSSSNPFDATSHRQSWPGGKDGGNVATDAAQSNHRSTPTLDVSRHFSQANGDESSDAIFRDLIGDGIASGRSAVQDHQHVDATSARAGSSRLLVDTLPRFTIDRQGDLVSPSEPSLPPFSGPQDISNSVPSQHSGQEPPRKRQKMMDSDTPNLDTYPKHTPSDPPSLHTSQRESTADENVNMRERFLQAKKDHQLSAPAGPLSVSARQMTPLGRRTGSENEEWMKYVFHEDFNRRVKTFSFSPPTHQPQGERYRSNPAPMYQSLPQSHHPDRSDHQSMGRSSSISIPTGVNASMYPAFAPPSQSVPNPSLPSETDFISRLSPMEGVIDDGLGPVSLHGNAALSAAPAKAMGQLRSSESYEWREHAESFFATTAASTPLWINNGDTGRLPNVQSSQPHAAWSRGSMSQRSISQRSVYREQLPFARTQLTDSAAQSTGKLMGKAGWDQRSTHGLLSSAAQSFWTS
ncbi:uncharacterized protein AB675_10661 [Cyphellophora attinorum]|uniref:Uncharacterized protein n=1 Tax=Cyphellophora attinorum TaxID=1664694 RepID=A0A0N1HA71_9EURO|nr:uncharacterized protein AB675_10661 [Phialophora attinorum]KPI40805.1 hypothetical protein AB675_10661 [Phialophora attinorum]